MKKVLLVGSGAREHAIAEALTRGGGVELFVYGTAKNPGIFGLAAGYEIGSLKDFAAMTEFAKRAGVDFAFIGPDNPIGDGAADALLAIEIHSVAPLQSVARVESSKSFTRDLLKKHNLPGNPEFRVFFDNNGMREYLEYLSERFGELHFVVKADGLMGGKGVKVGGDHLQSIDDAEQFARECVVSNGRVVIEEKLVGQEFSFMSFVDGKTVVDMVPVQDHKRAFDGDSGPNTGGMGSYSDSNHLLPFLEKRDLELAHEINQNTVDALFLETGIQFKGILYGGFIAVRDGVRLIEYNARFGDPEAMNVLPILETDFVSVCEAIISGELHSLGPVTFQKKATVCKYVVPEGYPDHAKNDQKIEIADEAIEANMYFSSVDQRADGLYMSSSRALAFVGIGDTLAEAEAVAARALQNVSGPVFYRKDIGTASLIHKRVEMMRKLRR